MGDKDFFLSPDDSQTMGDINYMRTTKRTRRTFPKTLKNKDGFAIENAVSSVEDNSDMYQSNDSNVNSTVSSTPSTFQSQAAPAPAPAPKTKVQSEDNDMDMFRNMAKKIRR